VIRATNRPTTTLLDRAGCPDADDHLTAHATASGTLTPPELDLDGYLECLQRCRDKFRGSDSLVLLEDGGRDPAAGADRDAMVFSPRPHLAAALAASRRPRRPARRSAVRLTGVLNARRQLHSENAGVLGAQVDLVLGAVEGESHTLIRRAAIQA